MRTDKLPWRRMLSSFFVYVLFYLLFRAVTNWHLFATKGLWQELSDLTAGALMSGVFFVIGWQLLAAFQRRRRSRLSTTWSVPGR